MSDERTIQEIGPISVGAGRHCHGRRGHELHSLGPGEAAGHRDLRLLHGGEDLFGVVQHQRHLGKAHLGPLLRAAENHVLHLGAPEAFGALLAHDPADGVWKYSDFPETVWAHNGGDILPEVQDGLVREGLKALNFQRF